MKSKAIILEMDPRRNSQYYRILSHPLTISVLETIGPVLKPVEEEFKISLKANKISKSKQSFSTTEQPTLTPEQEYHYTAFYYVSNLTHVVERLEHIPFYVKRFHNSKTFKDHGITLHEWLHYHHSAYLITVIGAYDLALLIVNAILALGIHPRKCNDRSVTNHPRVHKFKIKPHIEKLRETTKDHKDPRNLFVHHGALPKLEMLDMIETERFMKASAELLGISERIKPLIHPRIAEILYQNERRELVKSISARTVLIANDLYELFNTLHPIYLAYTAHLREHYKG